MQDSWSYKSNQIFMPKNPVCPSMKLSTFLGTSFLSCFPQKKVAINSRVCCTLLIRCALESPDPGASNGGSNFIFRHFGADLVTFEMDNCSRFWTLSKCRIDENVQNIWMPSHFKSGKVSPKVSEKKGLTHRWIRQGSAFQRTSN